MYCSTDYFSQRYCSFVKYTYPEYLHTLYFEKLSVINDLEKLFLSVHPTRLTIYFYSQLIFIVHYAMAV